MAIKYNININGLRPFDVKVKYRTTKNKNGYQEVKVEAKNGRTAGFEAQKLVKKQPQVKSAKWLYAIDCSDGTIHY